LDWGVDGRKAMPELSTTQWIIVLIVLKGVVDYWVKHTKSTADDEVVDWVFHQIQKVLRPGG
jgi:hypothetical protein